MEVNILTSKDQAIGAIICIACLAIAAVYIGALFWPALEAIRIWVIAIPVLIGFTGILAIGAWIGWTMATTPPPRPIDDVATEKTEETPENK